MHFGVTGWSHLICRKNKNIWLAIKQINGWINFYSYCVAHCHHPIYFTRSKNSTERERAPNTWITNGRITLYCYVFFHYSYPLGIDSGTNSNLLTTFIRRVGYTAKTNCEDARWPLSYMVDTAEREYGEIATLPPVSRMYFTAQLLHKRAIKTLFLNK